MSDSVPDGWSQASIGSFGKVVTGSTPSTKKNAYWNGSIPFISPADFDDSVYIKKTERCITEKGISVSRELPENSILVTCIGSIGGIAMTSKRSISNQQINAIVCNNKYNSRFIYYIIQFNISELDRLAGKTTLPIINKSTFELISLVVPPLPEQQKIASILTSVDTVIEKTEAQINKLKDLKNAMMQELLTKGIGHTEFKDSPVGRIPKGWEVVTLKNCISDISSGWSPVCEPTARRGNEWAVLKTTAIVWSGYAPYENKILPQKCAPRENAVVRKNDVLITRKGPRERVGVSVFVGESPANLMIPDTVFRIGIQKGIEPSFISLAIGSKRVQKEWNERKVGLAEAQVNINHPIINTTLISLPPLSEQQNFTSIQISLDNQINKKQYKLHHTKSLKKALMQDMLTGKVRVSLN
jgi:type I restriction enzyme, S subunit